MNKIFTFILEALAYMQIIASFFIISLGVGAGLYFYFPNVFTLVLAFLLPIVGLSFGLWFANKQSKADGAVAFMARVDATPDLDKIDVK
jgi:hypothetical protein